MLYNMSKTLYNMQKMLYNMSETLYNMQKMLHDMSKTLYNMQKIGYYTKMGFNGKSVVEIWKSWVVSKLFDIRKSIIVSK